MPGVDSNTPTERHRDDATTHNLGTEDSGRPSGTAGRCVAPRPQDQDEFAPPREFTSKELNKLNQRYNAHVAYRGKVGRIISSVGEISFAANNCAPVSTLVIPPRAGSANLNGACGEITYTKFYHNV